MVFQVCGLKLKMRLSTVIFFLIYLQNVFVSIHYVFQM